MPSSERKYILRTVDGQEYGPVDQDTLIRWAENRRVTASSQIRSTLFPRWEYACDVSFLRDLIAAQLEEEEEEQASPLSRLKSRLTMRATRDKKGSGIKEVKLADYPPAPMVFRVLAGVTDLFVVLTYAIVVYLLMAYFCSRGFDPDIALYLGFILFYVGLLMYFTWTVCFYSQTFGQRFWGVLVVRNREDVIYMGRAFVFTVSLLLFGVLTPFWSYVNPSGRALQEMISGTRVVKTRFVHESR